MENLIDHLSTGAAVILATVAVFLSRRGLRATRRSQKIEDLVPKAVDAALAHVSPAEQALLDVRRVATRFAIHLDAEDGKRDFSDERLYSEVCAELARRKL